MNVVNIALEGKLYARQASVSELKEAFWRRKRELVLLVGEAGSGKSCLAETLRKVVLEEGGYFISGKHDELQSDNAVAVASHPIALALTELMEYLRKDEKLLEAVRAAVQQEIAAEGHLLTDMIPALDAVVSNSNAITNVNVGPSCLRATQVGRDGFDLVFGKLVRSIDSAITAEHRLVLFMDDLQWSDSWSLSLLLILLRNKSNNWFVFGAVRDNEVLPNDKLSAVLRELEDHDKMIITQIKVGSLGESGVKEAIIDLIQQPEEDCQSLISLVYEQTGGNPLFLRQYLHYLFDEGLLLVDPETNVLCWRQEQLEANRFSDVGNMLQAKMKKLDPSLQRVLEVAAFLGTEVSRTLLDAAESGGATLIEVAVQKGFLYRKGDILRWQHDKMRQAAFELVASSNCDALSLSIGWSLYRNLTESQLTENLFVVLGQLSCGAKLLELQEDKIAVAKLCLRGGEKAMLCSNFVTAASCFALGLDLLSTRSWRDEYDLTLALHNSASEAEYCVGNLSRMDDLIGSVLQNAREFHDKVHASTLQICALGARRRHQEAAYMGLHVLGKLGERFPSRGLKIAALKGLAMTTFKLRRTTTEQLLDLPVMTDPNRLATMRILALLLPSASVSSPALASLFIVRLVTITLNHGISAPSSLAFASFAILLVRRGNINEAFRYGQLALAMVQKFRATEYLPRVFRALYAAVNTWKSSLRSCLERLEFSHEVAMETGDIETAMINRHLHSLNSIWAGRRLEDILLEVRQQLVLMEKYGQDMAYRFGWLLQQFLLNMTGRSQDPLQITFDTINQQVGESDKVTETAAIYYQFVIAFYMNEYELAEELARRSRPNKLFDSGTLMFCLHCFYEAMAILAMARRYRDQVRLFRAKRILRRLQKYEVISPHNCQNKMLLVEAEIAACSGKMESALTKFTRSIDKAGEQGFIHEQALACEWAGLALRQSSDFAGAEPFFRRAQLLYQEWGASAKVIQMNKVYSLDACNSNELHESNHTTDFVNGRAQ